MEEPVEKSAKTPFAVMASRATSGGRRKGFGDAARSGCGSSVDLGRGASADRPHVMASLPGRFIEPPTDADAKRKPALADSMDSADVSPGLWIGFRACLPASRRFFSTKRAQAVTSLPRQIHGGSARVDAPSRCPP